MFTLGQRALAAIAFAVSVLCPVARAQQDRAEVVVPGVGRLTPASDWVVLRAPELQMPSRATDPTEDPARRLLVTFCSTLSARSRAEEHVVLQQPGASPTQLRLINAYAVERRMGVAELLEPSMIASFRSGFETALVSPENTIEFVEERVLDLFTDVKCLSLTFRTTSAGDSWLLTYYFVPSGPRLTYFETVHFPADIEAQAKIEDVLRTFNGGVDPDATGNLLMAMTAGGITGGILGTLLAVLRRKRRLRMLEQQHNQC